MVRLAAEVALPGPGAVVLPMLLIQLDPQPDPNMETAGLITVQHMKHLINSKVLFGEPYMYMYM